MRRIASSTEGGQPGASGCDLLRVRCVPIVGMVRRDHYDAENAMSARERARPALTRLNMHVNVGAQTRRMKALPYAESRRGVSAVRISSVIGMPMA